MVVDRPVVDRVVERAACGFGKDCVDWLLRLDMISWAAKADMVSDDTDEIEEVVGDAERVICEGVLTDVGRS